MNGSADKPAWQPLTFGGVAAFARATTSRLLIAQSIVALLAAAAVVWHCKVNYSAVIEQALHRIPDGTVIRQGELAGTGAQLLAENRRLSIVIDLDGSRRLGQTADVQVELRRSDLKICSLLGCLFLEYPRDREIAIGRSALIPWWGAWEPVILTGIGVLVAAGLLIAWALLAAIYMWPVKFIAYYADRDVSWGGAWRLGAAALLPGALVLTAAIVLHAWQWIDLIWLGFLFGVHLVAGWTYLAAAALHAPRLVPLGENPFAEATPVEGASPEKNPFV